MQKNYSTSHFMCSYSFEWVFVLLKQRQLCYSFVLSICLGSNFCIYDIKKWIMMQKLEPRMAGLKLTIIGHVDRVNVFRCYNVSFGLFFDQIRRAIQGLTVSSNNTVNRSIFYVIRLKIDVNLSRFFVMKETRLKQVEIML